MFNSNTLPPKRIHCEVLRIAGCCLYWVFWETQFRASGAGVREDPDDALHRLKNDGGIVLLLNDWNMLMTAEQIFEAVLSIGKV
jgi:hypothetical protein